jgi:hypothetical protein
VRTAIVIVGLNLALAAAVPGLAIVGCAAMQKPAESKIASESYLIPSSDAGIQLYIRNKHAEGMSRSSAERIP